jgi:hypothetical protein
MTDNLATDPGGKAARAVSLIPNLLTPKEAAARLKMSTSFLAKKRLDGTGPRYVRVGHAIRYPEPWLLEWIKGRQRFSTSVS